MYPPQMGDGLNQGLPKVREVFLGHYPSQALRWAWYLDQVRPILFSQFTSYITDLNRCEFIRFATLAFIIVLFGSKQENAY